MPYKQHQFQSLPVVCPRNLRGFFFFFTPLVLKAALSTQAGLKITPIIMPPEC